MKKALLLIVSALSWVQSSPAAEPPITVENVRVGFAEQPSAGLYRVGTWTPVGIDLKAGDARFQGVVEAIVPDDDGTSSVVRQVIDIPAREMRSTTVYVRPGSRTAAVEVRARDSEGRLRGRPVEQSSAETVEASQTLIATMGDPRGVDEIATMPGFSAANSQRDAPLRTVKVRAGGGLGRDGIPGRWYGYDAADVVVLDTNDRNLMAILNGPKGLALKEWVRRGGHLVVSVGANWQQAADPTASVLHPMLPALPQGTIPLRDLGALESYAGATGTKGKLDAMTVAKLVPVEGRGALVLAQTAATPPTPLVVRGPYGFGRVTVVAIDADQKPFADWAFKKDFWVKALDLRPRDQTNTQNVAFAPGAFIQGSSGDLAGVLHLALERFPGVRLVPFGWVAFFVFIYILLIGPGDYFFLKKVLKRMELTWITFPLIVVTVSLLAYVAAYAVKGTDLRVNQIDAVDIDQSQPKGTSMRGTTWLTLFSPRNRDYGLSVVPLGFDRDANAPAPTAPPPGSDVLVSWFGGPDPILGGGDRLGLSGATYAYNPIGEAERLEGVRVAIWSTKSFAARWSGPAAPAVESDLRPVGADRLNGTITNRLNRPLKDAWVAFGSQVYPLGTLAPNATIRVDSAQNRVLSSLLEEEARRSNFGQGNQVNYGPDGEPQPVARGGLIRALMFRDAMTNAPNVPPSHPLRYLDLSGQLALERPMLVAEVAGPAASIQLNGAPSTPKVEQTTVLRVLLPLADTPSDSN